MPGANAQHCRYCSINFLLLDRLDLNVDAGWKIKLHQRVYRLLSRLENVDQPLVGANLERLARLFVDMGRPQHAVLVLHRRQRNGPRNLRAGAFRRIHDLAGRRIEHAVVVSLQTNPASLSCHFASLFLLLKDRLEWLPVMNFYTCRQPSFIWLQHVWDYLM